MKSAENASSPEQTHTFAVPENFAHCRLDVYLSQCNLGLSRSQIQKLIREGNVQIVNKGVKPNFVLRGGEKITITIPENEPFRLVPEQMPLDIIFEDEWLIVVNKPAGIVTHPARGNFEHTLLHGIIEHTKVISPVGGDLRPGVVHRLDKDTSGLIVFAKTALAHNALAHLLAERKISRRYLCFAWGHLRETHVDIDLPLGIHPKNRLLRAVVPNAQTARTEFFVRASFDFCDFLEAQLHTGRTHQIRVHLAHISHPVMGDADYGGSEERLSGVAPQHRLLARKILAATTRQLLHAYRMELEHPMTHEKITLLAPLPRDFLMVFETLGFDANVFVEPLYL